MSAEFPRVLFIDLDGVICDTFRFHMKGWLHICHKHNLNFPNQRLNEFYGVTTKTAIQKILDYNKKNISTTKLEELVLLKNLIRDREIDKLTPLDINIGIKKFIYDSRDKGVQIVCIATTKACHRILTKLELVHVFDELIYGDLQVPLKNENAQCISNYLKKVNVLKKEVLFIDDGYIPVQHAINSKIPSCLFSNRLNTDFLSDVVLVNDLSYPIEYYYKLAYKYIYL